MRPHCGLDGETQEKPDILGETVKSVALLVLAIDPGHPSCNIAAPFETCVGRHFLELGPKRGVTNKMGPDWARIAEAMLPPCARGRD